MKICIEEKVHSPTQKRKKNTVWKLLSITQQQNEESKVLNLSMHTQVVRSVNAPEIHSKFGIRLSLKSTCETGACRRANHTNFRMWSVVTAQTVHDAWKFMFCHFLGVCCCLLTIYILNQFSNITFDFAQAHNVVLAILERFDWLKMARSNYVWQIVLHLMCVMQF